MTVRFFGLIPRKPEISSEEFHDHYRYPHGALGLGLEKMRLYVQSHQFETDLLGPDQRRYEAIAEGWYDTPTDGMGLGTHPHYVAHLLPDEPLFVDIPNLKWLYTDESLVYNKSEDDSGLEEAERWWSPEVVPTSVKLLQFLSKDDAAAQKSAALDLARTVGAQRFIRSEPNAEVYASDTPAFYAVHEFWWPTYCELQSAVRAEPDSWKTLSTLGAGSVSLIARAERFR